MGNDLVNAIARTLDREFGIDIHVDEVKQGFDEPCFFIQSLDMSSKPLLGRNRQVYELDIIRFGGDNDTLRATAETLLLLLKSITLDDESTIRGYNMRYWIHDKVLHFFVTCAAHVYVAETSEMMGDVQINQNVKE